MLQTKRKQGDREMTVKKIRNADFHNANKLNGQKSHAAYGLFRDGVQIGHVRCNGRLWNVFDSNSNRINSYSFGSLKQLKTWAESN